MRPEFRSEGRYAAVFKDVDELSQIPFVLAVRINRVIAGQTGAAQTTAAVFIEGRSVQERRAAIRRRSALP